MKPTNGIISFRAVTLALAILLVLSVGLCSCDTDTSGTVSEQASVSTAESSSAVSDVSEEESSEEAESLVEYPSRPVKSSAPESYIWLKRPDNESPYPSITFIINAGDFDANAEYTFYCKANFSVEATQNGLAYVNAYCYGDYEAALEGEWDYLLAFNDFAKSYNSIPDMWGDFSATFNPSVSTYGGAGERVEAITMGMGFSGSTGEIRLYELGIRDSAGHTVWSRCFDNGLDLDDPDLHSAFLPGDEGVLYGFVTEEN